MVLKTKNLPRHQYHRVQFSTHAVFKLFSLSFTWHLLQYLIRV